MIGTTPIPVGTVLDDTSGINVNEIAPAMISFACAGIIFPAKIGATANSPPTRQSTSTKSTACWPANCRRSATFLNAHATIEGMLRKSAWV